MKFTIRALPALSGDCFILSFLDYSEKINIIIDGGSGRASYIKLKSELNDILQRDELIDLLVVTHTDEDHIFGIMKIFEDENISKKNIKKIWFNSGLNIAKHFGYSNTEEKEILLESEEKKMSIKQGITLEDKLILHPGWENKIITKGSKLVLKNVKITVLSPNADDLNDFWNKWEIESNNNKKVSSDIRDYEYSIEYLAKKKFKEDSALPNKTSISFLIEHQNLKILMLADAHPSNIENSLIELGFSNENKIRVDLIKVSHHGSKHNTSDTLLSMIECNNFLISTDGSHHGFPHKESLARIVNNSKSGTNFYFNYEMDVFKEIFTIEEIEQYNITINFIDDSLTLS